MKHVVTIAELYKLIPSTRELEGVNFKDMKTLVITVIQKIEKNGNWEFIQYISGNPSLFVVKEKEISVYQTLPRTKYDNAFEEINNHYNQEIIRNNDIETHKIESTKVKNPETLQKEEKVAPLYESLPDSDSTLFPETKMPW